MSKLWGLKCETCDKRTDYWLNHGKGYLAQLVTGWPIIKQAIEVLDPYFQLRYNPLDETILFLQEHEGHTILIVSEAGDRAPAVAGFEDEV